MKNPAAQPAVGADRESFALFWRAGPLSRKALGRWTRNMILAHEDPVRREFGNQIVYGLDDRRRVIDIV